MNDELQSTKKGHASIQLVTFRLGFENYGVPVSKIREIIMPIKAFPVPGLSEPVEGVINLRGEIIPVVRLQPVLNSDNSGCLEDERKQRVIILDHESGGFGFVVDEVWEVVKISAADIKPAPDVAGDGLSGEAVTGIVDIAGKMVICIEPRHLIKNLVNTENLAIECT